MPVVPSQFEIAGLTIKVTLDETLGKDKKVVGEAKYATQQIILDPTTCTEEGLYQNFLHEFTHWIFYITGHDDLRNNENLVDLIAHFYHQMNKTARYDR